MSNVGNDTIVHDVDIDLSDSFKAISQLQARLKDFQGDLVSAVGQVQNQMKSAANSYGGYIRRLETELKQLRSTGQDTSRHEAALAGVRNRARGDYASGSGFDQNAQAYIDRRIAQLRSTETALGNKLSREVVKQLTDAIKLTQDQIRATLREEQFKAERLLGRTTEPMMSARRANAAFADSEYLKNAAHIGIRGKKADIRREIETFEQSVGAFQARVLNSSFRATQAVMDTEAVQLAARQRQAAAQRYRRASTFGSDADVDLAARVTDYQAGRRRTRYSDEALDARRTIDARNDEDLIYRARYGDAAAGWSRTRERMGSNGGADMLLAQAGILSNYLAVGASMGAGGYLANFVVELDAELKNLQAISNTTNTDMAGLQERLLSVAEQSKFTAVEVAGAATQLAQAGLTAQQIGQAVEPITMLATAAGTDLANAIDLVSSTMGAFNLNATESADIANTYVAALNRSKLTLDQLSLALQYAGSTAATVGVSYNELTAAAGTLANVGIRSGSTIGTGLRQLMVDLLNPTAKMKAEMKALGLTMADIDIEANGLTGVLTNLQAAGFDTARAYEGLEVRAAAAYAALSSNIQTITDLRQSFLLSNAALEANQIQMESLANTASNAASSIGALVYTGLTPYLAIIQDVLQGTTAFTSSLRQNEAVVQVITSGLAGLATGWAVLKAGGVIVGLARIASGAQEANGALGTLFSLIRVHPIGLAIAGLTTAVLLLRNFTDASEAAARQLDELRSTQEGYKGTIDETNNRLESLDGAINDLIAKQQQLDKVGNGELRRARVLEVVSTFTELAGKIDLSTTSVRSLIEAMQDLRGELTKQLPEQYDAMTANLREQLGVLREEFARYSEGEGQQGALNAAVSRYGRDVDPGAVVEAKDFYARVQKDFPEAAQAFRAVTGGEEIDAITAKSLLAILDKLVTVETTRLRELDKANTGFFSTDEQSESADRLAFLSTLKEVFGPLAANVLKQGQTELELGVSEREATDARLANLPGFQVQDKAVDALKTALRIEEARILESGMSTEEMKVAIEGLNATYQSRVDEITKNLDGLAAELVKLDPGLTLEKAKEAIDGSKIPEALALMKSQIAQFSKEPLKAFREIQKMEAEDRASGLKKDRSGLLNQLSKVATEQEVDFIESRLKTVAEALKNAELELFGLDEGRATKDDIVADAAARERLRREIDKETQEGMESVLDARTRIYKEAGERREAVAKAELTRVRNEIEGLTGALKQDQTTDAFRTAAAKLAELQAEAQKLAAEIAGIQVGTTNLTAPAGGEYAPNYIPTGDLSTDMGRYREAIHMIESRGKPNNGYGAIGVYNKKLGHPLGRYQIMEANLAPWSQAALGRTVSRAEFMSNPQIQDQIFDHRFGGYVRKYGPERAARAWIGGEGKVERGLDTQDVLGTSVGSYGQKFLRNLASLSPATAGGRGGEVATVTANLLEPINDATAKIEKAAAVAAGKRLSNQADAIEAEISGLMARAGQINDPAGFKPIIDQVTAKWGDVASKEREAFTIANQGAEDFDEQLKTLDRELAADLNNKLSRLLDQYQSKIEAETSPALKAAELKLKAAQESGHFNETELQGLERDVRLQREADARDKLNKLQEFGIYVQERLTEAEKVYGANSEQAIGLRTRLAETERTLGNVRSELGAKTEAAAKSQSDFGAAIQNANNLWMQSNGLMDAKGRMVSAAQQAGDAWGQILDTLDTGFSTLFMDLAMGSESAGESFKKFALTVVQSFMEMIAQALAFQAVQALIGATGGSEGFLGSLLGSLTGAANGTVVPGMKRAADGTIVQGVGGAAFRDSQHYALMPGEAVLRASAVQAVGRDGIDRLNAQGNRRVSEGMPAIPATQGGDKHVNVYAVLPEERQSLGPNDVVAIISDDIRRRGQTRSLIHQVNLGKM